MHTLAHKFNPIHVCCPTIALPHTHSHTYIYTQCFRQPDVRGINKVGSQHGAPYPLELIHFTTLPLPLFLTDNLCPHLHLLIRLFSFSFYLFISLFFIYLHPYPPFCLAPPDPLLLLLPSPLLLSFPAGVLDLLCQAGEVVLESAPRLWL